MRIGILGSGLNDHSMFAADTLLIRPSEQRGVRVL